MTSTRGFKHSNDDDYRDGRGQVFEAVAAYRGAKDGEHLRVEVFERLGDRVPCDQPGKIPAAGVAFQVLLNFVLSLGLGTSSTCQRHDDIR